MDVPSPGMADEKVWRPGTRLCLCNICAGRNIWLPRSTWYRHERSNGSSRKRRLSGRHVSLADVTPYTPSIPREDDDDASNEVAHSEGDSKISAGDADIVRNEVERDKDGDSMRDVAKSHDEYIRANVPSVEESDEHRNLSNESQLLTGDVNKGTVRDDEPVDSHAVDEDNKGVWVDDDASYDNSVSSDSYMEKEMEGKHDYDSDDCVSDKMVSQEARAVSWSEEMDSEAAFCSSNDEDSVDTKASGEEAMAKFHPYIHGAGIDLRVYSQLNNTEKTNLEHLCNYYGDMFHINANEQRADFEKRMEDIRSMLVREAECKAINDGDVRIDDAVSGFIEGLNKIKSERAWSREELEAVLNLTATHFGDYVNKRRRPFPTTEYLFNKELILMGKHDGIIRGEKVSVCKCGKTVFTGKASNDVRCVECWNVRKVTGTNDYFYHCLYDRYAKLYKDPKAVELMESWYVRSPIKLYTPHT